MPIGAASSDGTPCFANDSCDSSPENLEVVCEVSPLLWRPKRSVGFLSALGEMTSKRRITGVQSSPHELHRLVASNGDDSSDDMEGATLQVTQTIPKGAQGLSSKAQVAIASRGLGRQLSGPLGGTSSRQVPVPRHRRLLRAGSLPIKEDAASGVLIEERKATMADLGLPGLLRRRESSVNLMSRASVEDLAAGICMRHAGSMLELTAPSMSDLAEASKTSILDFEHLFLQYFVEVRPRWQHPFWPHRKGEAVRQQLRRLRRRSERELPTLVGAVAVMPSAHEVAEEWKVAAVQTVWEQRAACQQRWPELRLSKRALAKTLDSELVWHDQLKGPNGRVTLTLEPERICHRLLWALGDAAPPSQILFDIQARLRRRWPHCHIRCTDDIINPASVVRTLFFVFSVLLLLSLRVAYFAALVVSARLSEPVASNGKKRYLAPGQASNEELLDQLAARLLLVGALSQLWLLHAVAASFPMRSLHSPFHRDFGCLAAYSRTTLWLCRIAAPCVMLFVPSAAAVRFYRLGLLTSALPGLHWAILAGSACLPVLAGVAAWSVRSSLYSHHQFFIALLFTTQMALIAATAAYMEMVKWAVFGAGALIIFAFFLLYRYFEEFTTVQLLKAAQLQWACAHMVPILLLLSSVALEVESGVARVLVDFICENQDVMPTRMCIRLLRNAD